MSLQVIKDCHLGVEVALVQHLDEVDQHVGPELIGWVWLEDHHSYVVLQLLNQLDELLGCAEPLEDREVEGSQHSLHPV